MGGTKKKNTTKDVVSGLGEIGRPIFQLISKGTPSLGRKNGIVKRDDKEAWRGDSWLV